MLSKIAQFEEKQNHDFGHILMMLLVSTSAKVAELASKPYDQSDFLILDFFNVSVLGRFLKILIF